MTDVDFILTYPHSVVTVLTTHPCVSQCFRVKPSVLFRLLLYMYPCVFLFCACLCVYIWVYMCIQVYTQYVNVSVFQYCIYELICVYICKHQYLSIPFCRVWQLSHTVLQSIQIFVFSLGWCGRDVAPLPTHWSCAFLPLIHWFHPRQYKKNHMSDNWAGSTYFKMYF